MVKMKELAIEILECGLSIPELKLVRFWTRQYYVYFRAWHNKDHVWRFVSNDYIDCYFWR